MSLFATRYRITRDWLDSDYWMVQKRLWWLPIWMEVCGLLNSKADAMDLIETIRREYQLGAGPLPRPHPQEDKP